MVHADGLHDFLGRRVGLSGEGHDFCQRQPVKPTPQSGPRRFTGVAQAPVLACQAPADFGRGSEWRVETHYTQPCKADELAGVLALQGPQAETMLGKMPAYAPDHVYYKGFIRGACPSLSNTASSTSGTNDI